MRYIPYEEWDGVKIPSCCGVLVPHNYLEGIEQAPLNSYADKRGQSHRNQWMDYRVICVALFLREALGWEIKYART